MLILLFILFHLFFFVCNKCAKVVSVVVSRKACHTLRHRILTVKLT